MTRLSALCLALLVASALSLVSAQYRTRQLFIDQERARAAEKRLDVEWRQLQLDQTNWSKHALIESAAVRDLRMLRATRDRTESLVLAAPATGR